MPNQPFRFLHAGDFHLESPLGGVTEVPPHLRELFLEAPYLAAERVFETALAEEVDFLVLAGNLLQPWQTGPRGPLFLIEQFERLSQRGIAVYWAGGEVDSPESWPDAIALPDNVSIFARGIVEQVIHRRDDEPLARIVGRSYDGKKKIRSADFSIGDDGLFNLAICHGTAEPARLAGVPIGYWALGGRAGRRTLAATEPVMHYAGSPQGRRPQEAGPHGCSLVQVDARGRAHISFLPTDVIRWHQEEIILEPTTTRAELESQLRDRIESAANDASNTDLLISWTLTGTGPLVTRLRRTMASELLDWLRKEFGTKSPVAWTVSLSAEWPVTLNSEWYDQETLLGDFLREVRRQERDEQLPLDLTAYLGDRANSETWNELASVAENELRHAVLHDVQALGIDLLSGEGTSP